MKLTVVGCGDAFGSGGRLQTCYHVETSETRFLIDCGATAMIGLNRLGIDPNGVETIFISHLHGDHYAGLVWWLLHAQHIARRNTPLTVVGPAGIEARFIAACDALFPGSAQVSRRFELRFLECTAGEALDVGLVRVTPYLVSHPSGAPSHALRFETAGKVLSFSGDTEWVNTLVPTSAGADLFMTECYAYEGAIRYHTTWKVLEEKLPSLTCKRVLLTHMNASMLANRDKVTVANVSFAEDGLVVEV